MSFLLDALGRADDDRRRKDIPELHSRAIKYRSPWRYVFLGVLMAALLLLAFTLGYLLRPALDTTLFQEEPGPAAAPLAAAQSSPAETAAPPQPVAAEKSADSAVKPDTAAKPGYELEVISYAAEPSARFAMINGIVVHEGDVLGGGERLSKIEKDAVVLDVSGRSVRIGM